MAKDYERFAGQASISAQQRVPELDGAYNALAANLAAAIENARSRTEDYVYLKHWTLTDATRWLKVRITSTLNRRDAE